MVQLSDDLVKRLDEEAQERGVSRSALIRTVLTEFLKTESLQAKIERYVEGYRRMPQPTIDEWGNLEEDAERDLARMSREFDDEEAAAGRSW
jgi:metal-responsive CopG/Arc/MetJ family transcriptional regulator